MFGFCFQIVSEMENFAMRVLHMTLKKKWFDMIASGKKREEYREMKPYWHKRLMTKTYDVIKFMNGYNADSPTMVVELRKILSGLGIVEWGAPEGEEVYILRLGRILVPPTTKNQEGKCHYSKR